MKAVVIIDAAIEEHGKSLNACSVCKRVTENGQLPMFATFPQVSKVVVCLARNHKTGFQQHLQDQRLPMKVPDSKDQAMLIKSNFMDNFSRQVFLD